MADPSGPDTGQDAGETPDTLRIGDDVVRFRDFQPGDEAQIVEVYRAAYGGFYPAEKPVNEYDYVTWFTELHDSHKARAMLAEVDSEIVFVAAGVLRPVKIGDATLRGYIGGIGAATRPDFQRKGINRAQARWNRATDGPSRTASVDMRRAGMRGRRSNPVPSSGEMSVYLYVQRPWRAARARRAGLAALNALPSTAMALWSGLRSRVGPKGAPDVTVRTLAAFDERFEPFWERAAAGWDIIPVRTVEFLNWRFCDPRAGVFTVRAAEAEGELVGYSVVHAVGARGHIMDLLALPGRLDVVRALVDDALTQLREAETAAVECWMLREQPYAHVLRQAGFVRLRGRSAEIAGEVGWSGGGIGPEERAMIASPQARVHLVRADFDAI